MSTYWRAYCLECDEGTVMLGNHVEKDIVECVGIYRRIRAVLTDAELHGLSRFEANFLFDSGDETFAQFMKKHHTHSLSARSEYWKTLASPDRDEVFIG